MGKSHVLVSPRESMTAKEWQAQDLMCSSVTRSLDLHRGVFLAHGAPKIMVIRVWRYVKQLNFNVIKQNIFRLNNRRGSPSWTNLFFWGTKTTNWKLSHKSNDICCFLINGLSTQTQPLVFVRALSGQSWLPWMLYNMQNYDYGKQKKLL